MNVLCIYSFCYFFHCFMLDYMIKYASLIYFTSISIDYSNYPHLPLYGKMDRVSQIQYNLQKYIETNQNDHVWFKLWHCNCIRTSDSPKICVAIFVQLCFFYIIVYFFFSKFFNIMCINMFNECQNCKNKWTWVQINPHYAPYLIKPIFCQNLLAGFRKFIELNSFLK